MSSLSQAGKPLSLDLQLSDGDASLPKVVKSFLKNESGSLIDILELSHIGNGLFVNGNPYLMPDISRMFAQYIVYESDGTTRDDFYPVTYETYINASNLDLGGSSSSYSDAGNIQVVVEEDPVQEIEVIVD